MNDLRIHDVFLKFQHVQLGEAVIQKIKDENNDSLLKILGNELRIEQAFTRGAGITDFKFNLIEGSVSPPIILGIQIQGMAFKLFLEKLDGNAEILASLIFESNLWFNFDFIPETVSDKTKIMPQRVRFNRYNNTFMYKYVKLRECKIDDLLETIYRYLVYLLNNKNNIKQLIS